MPARARTALVTGGAGFIGSHLVERLVADRWEVRVLDDLSTGREANLASVAGKVDFVLGDVRDRLVLERLLEDVDVVFHQAAIASVSRSVEDPVLTHSVNALGTLQLLSVARRTGVRRVVYAASCAVYGDGPELPKLETMTPQPLSPYALQKYVGELYCRMYAQNYGLESVALRYFNVYGTRQDPNGDYAAVIPKFIAACLAGESPRIYGDGEQTRDFVAVEDVVEANILAAAIRRARGLVCNVASGRETSLNRLVDLVRACTGSRASTRYDRAREGDIRRSVASLEEARKVLGYEPRVSLREGIIQTIGGFQGMDEESSL